MGWFAKGNKDDSSKRTTDSGNNHKTGNNSSSNQNSISSNLNNNAPNNHRVGNTLPRKSAPSQGSVPPSARSSLTPNKGSVPVPAAYAAPSAPLTREPVVSAANNSVSSLTNTNIHSSSNTNSIITGHSRKDKSGGQDTSSLISDSNTHNAPGGLMVIDRPPKVQENPKDFDVEDNSRMSSREESVHEPDSYNETSRQNHLNSLFNGHLMKWKFEAEEGSAFIRVPSFFGAIALIVTAIVAVVLYPGAWTTHSIVMTVCVVIMGIFITILEGRFLATNPLSARAHLRNIMTRNFNIFRFLWGRGLLYISAGVLNCAQTWLITLISGAFMIVMGFIAIIVGVHASRKFAALRNSLADESFLLLVFSNYDSDGDGFLAPNEFAVLLADLGMELDDRYTLKAFNVIDTDNDRRISFDEFSHWWASGYIERGRRRFGDDDDEESYRRLD